MGNVDNPNDVKLEGEPRAKAEYASKRECTLPLIANLKNKKNVYFCRKEGETISGPSSLLIFSFLKGR